MRRFSIITIARNDVAGLERTLQSLLKQTLTDFDWIVVDSASSDGTPDFLADAKRQMPMVLDWSSEPDRGIAHAWNKGIVRSRAEYILILNSGDTFTQRAVEQFNRACHPDRIICAHARLIGADGAATGIFKAQPYKLWRGMHIPHNWSCVPSDFYRRLGLYPELRDAMDFAWYHRAYKRLGRQGFQILDAVLGDFYLGGQSTQRVVESFEANRKILELNGTPAWASAMIYRAYLWNHRRVNGP